MNLRLQILGAICLIGSIGVLESCGSGAKMQAESSVKPEAQAVDVGVVRVARTALQQQLTQSSELVPFQQIDVYAKESGYVQKLLVDYGTHVKTGQLLATLEIPELQAQLQQDDAAIKNEGDMVTQTEHQLSRVEAQHQVLHLEFDRLNGVAKSKPGLVAQQEVDDAQGKDLAAEAQIEAAKASLQAVESQLAQAQAKREHDQVLFDYSRITAPFAGVVTQRYANLGTLVQAGTSSATAVLPIVQLAQDDLFRLVIPVPEPYVPYVRIGDPVSVTVTALDRTFPGKVARFSVDVREDTRTMHTEVDVPNRGGVLMPGMYADATLTLNRKPSALSVPLQALNREGGNTTVYLVESGKIVDRQVKLGIQTDRDAEVLSGLQEGDEIVVSDRSGLKAGEAVRPKTVELMQYSGSQDN